MLCSGDETFGVEKTERAGSQSNHYPCGGIVLWLFGCVSSLLKQQLTRPYFIQAFFGTTTNGRPTRMDNGCHIRLGQ